MPSPLTAARPARNQGDAPTGETVVVAVTGLAPGGDAVGRQVGGVTDGRVTFVPFAAPGERAHVHITRVRARVAWGELAKVDDPAPSRVTPQCPLFGTCGGCQWQHVDVATQRAAKGSIVARALNLGGPAAGIEAVAVGGAYGYRERVRLAVGEGGVVGFRRRQSHAIVDVPTCPLLAPALSAALPEARRRGERLAVGSEIHLLLGAEGVVGEAGGRGFHIADGRTTEADLAQPETWPDVAEAGGSALRVPPRGFAQVSRAANAALVAAVKAAITAQPGRVLELFAGSGNFTRHLTTCATEVIASDGDAAAVARGRRNVPAATWRLAEDLGTDFRPDTVLVDPPREGLQEHMLSLAASGERLVYVSCDPQTLGRDAARLLRRGMRLVSATAFDLMPQTHHVEVVALFTR